jgi:iron(III) transport system permease protein
VLGGFPAALVAQSKGKRGTLETLTFVASGVPGVMIGFGLLQLALRVPQGSLRSFAEGGAILLLGLALRFASHSYAALKPALLTQSEQSVEAARLLGASRWRVWHRVRGPHLAPALASGFLLSFVAVVKELPITLMLIPAGHTTLATRIFDAHEDAHLGDLGVAALSLLGMVLVAQALLWRWSRHER